MLMARGLEDIVGCSGRKEGERERKGEEKKNELEYEVHTKATCEKGTTPTPTRSEVHRADDRTHVTR
jgi:hypothetical protein